MKPVLIIATLFLSACIPEAEAESPSIDPLWPVEQQDCVREGGQWGRGGLSGQEMCFPQYSDAGEACSASSQCEGYCEAKTRQCSASIAFGCLTYLDDNGAFAAICID